MSSSAQPVNGIAPVTPVVLSSGVSTKPNGLAEARRNNVSLTAIGPGVFEAPFNTKHDRSGHAVATGRPPMKTTR